jgi:hypothetical protein
MEIVHFLDILLLFEHSDVYDEQHRYLKIEEEDGNRPFFETSSFYLNTALSTYGKQHRYLNNT